MRTGKNGAPEERPGLMKMMFMKRLLPGRNAMLFCALTAGLSLLLFLFAPAASAAAKTPKPTATPAPTLAPPQEAWPELPPLTEDGYLAEDAGQDEFIHTDVENGLWLYISPGLRVEIKRYGDPNIPLIWYEADIRTAGEDRLHSVPAKADRVDRALNFPETIARRSQVVFGINDDQFGQRKINGKTIGMVVRSGKVYGSSSRKSGGTGYPNLETLALFPDGGLKVYESREYSAQEYIDMGAVDVFAFGPILIRDGVINERLASYKEKDKQPRCSLGMVEPYHYVSVVVDGRHKGSEGANLMWLAQRLKDLGATQALNLDGGNTSAMVFMGERLNSSSGAGPDGLVRSISGLVAIGTSAKVPEYQAK